MARQDLTQRFPADAATRRLIAQGDTQAIFRAWAQLTEGLRPNTRQVVVAMWTRPKRHLLSRPQWCEVIVPGPDGLSGLLRRYLNSRCKNLSFVLMPVESAPDHPTNYDALFR